MKKLGLVFLLLLSTLSFAAKKPSNPADYAINVHVTASHMHMQVGVPGDLQFLDVLIAGKKYELAGTFGDALFQNGFVMLKPGDYKAKLVKDEHSAPYSSRQIYEFLMPDNTVLTFDVVGIIE
jgi:hypothetical protein